MTSRARREAVAFEQFVASTWTVTTLAATRAPRAPGAPRTPRAAGLLGVAWPADRPMAVGGPPLQEPAYRWASPQGPGWTPPPPDGWALPAPEHSAWGAVPAPAAAVASAGGDQAAITVGLGSQAARNTVVVLAARVLSRLIALVTVIAISRHLGADGFGRLQTLVTYTALTAVFVDVGFNTLYVREGARHPDLLARYLDNVLSVKALLSVVGLLVLDLTLRIPGLTDLIVPGFALMVLAAYSNVLRGTFYVTGRLGWEAADIVIESVVQLAVAAVGFALHKDAGFFVWAYAIGYGVSCVWFLTLTVALRIARPRWRFDLDILRPWLVTGLPLAVTYVLTNVYFKIDVPILQRARSYDEVGWYTLAYRPFEALLFIPFTIRQIVFPVMSVYSRELPARLRLGTQTLFRALLMAGWPCTVGLFLLAGPITGLLRLYPESEAALRILGLAVVVMFVDNTFAAVLLAMDRQKEYAAVALSGLVVNLGLDLVLIPSHGYLGAAAATVLTEVQLAVTGWAVLSRLGVRLDVPRLGWRILLAGAGMGLALAPFRHTRGVATVAAILLGAVVYGALLLMLRAVTAEERGLLSRALARARGSR